MKILRHYFILIFSFLLLSGCPSSTGVQVPFATTPMKVVDLMLEMGEVKKGDVVYDLGSGDGRIVIRAAKKYGARGVGIEIDPELVKRSRLNAKNEGVDHLVEFREQDALTVDVSPATVVTLYLLLEFNRILRPTLWKELKPGSRVVSHNFDMDDWKPIRVETVDGGLLPDHKIFLWKIK